MVITWIRGIKEEFTLPRRWEKLGVGGGGVFRQPRTLQTSPPWPSPDLLGVTACRLSLPWPLEIEAFFLPFCFPTLSGAWPPGPFRGWWAQTAAHRPAWVRGAQAPGLPKYEAAPPPLLFPWRRSHSRPSGSNGPCLQFA